MPLISSEAIAVARAGEPRVLASDEARPERVRTGDEVEVAALDYAREPSAGRLVYAGADEIAIERTDDRAGRVIVHFPRIGFRVKVRA